MNADVLKIEERTSFRRALRRLTGFLPSPRSNSPSAHTGGQIRVGLVGVGNVARWLYLPCLRRRASVFKLVAVHDVDVNSARKTAEEFGCRNCDSLSEVVGMDDVDAVFICTPVRHHCEAVLAALSAHKHVLCEKPLSLTFAQAEAMWKAAQRTDRVSMINFSYRFRVELVFIKRLIQGGVLGRVCHVSGALSQGQWFTREGEPSQERVDAAAWKFGPHGGVVLDVGPHLVDLCRWWLGEIESVRAWTKCFRTDAAPCEDACGFSLDFASGSVAHLLTSRWATGYKDRALLEISGSDGALCLDQGQIRLWTYDKPRWRVLMVPPLNESNILDRFAGAIRGNSASAPSFWDGLKNIEILEAIFLSARSGALVPLPFVGRWPVSFSQQPSSASGVTSPASP